jgi:oxalate decarboxylase
MLAGRARITAVDEQGRTFIDDVGVGDLWNFPSAIPHSIQGLERGCEFLLVFDSGSFSENETVLITDLFAHIPREVLAKNFGVPEVSPGKCRDQKPPMSLRQLPASCRTLSVTA